MSVPVPEKPAGSLTGPTGKLTRALYHGFTFPGICQK